MYQARITHSIGTNGGLPKRGNFAGLAPSRLVPQREGLTWVIRDQDGFDVLSRNATGETQYRYFRPGSYAAVVEAWGGSYYVEVSNEVEITC